MGQIVVILARYCMPFCMEKTLWTTGFLIRIETQQEVFLARIWNNWISNPERKTTGTSYLKWFEYCQASLYDNSHHKQEKYARSLMISKLHLQDLEWPEFVLQIICNLFFQWLLRYCIYFYSESIFSFRTWRIGCHVEDYILFSISYPWNALHGILEGGRNERLFKNYGFLIHNQKPDVIFINFVYDHTD
mgnify:CR=1 FL=1